jgi:molybdopterin-guanine dinucleotide biosynthesis protein A
MGRTKALVEVGGVPMASRVVTALRGAGCSSVVAVGGRPDELAVLDLPIVPDRHPGEGPLGGIIDVLQFVATSAALGHADVIVVACDLPYLEPGDLAPLVSTARLDRDADVVVALAGRRDPGCAIWRVSALSRLEDRFADGERAIHRVFADLSVVEVPVAERALRNINTLDDLGRYS